MISATRKAFSKNPGILKVLVGCKKSMESFFGIHQVLAVSHSYRKLLRGSLVKSNSTVWLAST